MPANPLSICDPDWSDSHAPSDRTPTPGDLRTADDVPTHHYL